MSKVEKYIGEAKISEQPTKKLTWMINDNVVANNHIKDNAVTEPKISGEDSPSGPAVTTAKIADKAVTTSKIADEAVTTEKLSSAGTPAGAAAATAETPYFSSIPFTNSFNSATVNLSIDSNKSSIFAILKFLLLNILNFKLFSYFLLTYYFKL